MQQKNERSLLPRSLRLLKEADSVRQAAVNELSFTYTRLLRLLPAIMRRMVADPLHDVLGQQHEQDGLISGGLTLMTTAHGVRPSLCACEEADGLLETMYHDERAATDDASRAMAVVDALKGVRTYLIRTWGRLIDTLSPENQVDFLREASALQGQEADLFSQLVAMRRELDKDKE